MKEQVIENWYKEISCFDNLSFSDAKKLYLEYLNTQGENQKRIIMDKIILGTLYNVYTYIKKYNLADACINCEEVEDIIGSLTNQWIQSIKAGALNVFKSYSDIINNDFMNNAYVELYGKSNTVFRKQKVARLFYEYYLLRRKGDKFNLYDVFDNAYDKYEYADESFDLRIIPLFEKIYETFDLDNKDEFDYNFFLNSIEFLVERAKTDKLSNDQVAEKDCIDETISSIFSDEIIDFLVNDIETGDTHRKIVRRYFGEYRVTAQEVADEMNMTRSAVNGALGTLENKIIGKRRINNRIDEKYKSFLREIK